MLSSYTLFGLVTILFGNARNIRSIHNPSIIECISQNVVDNSDTLFVYNNHVYEAANYEHPAGKKFIDKLLVHKDLNEFIDMSKYKFHLQKNNFFNDLEKMYVNKLCTTQLTTLPITFTTTSEPITFTNTTISEPITFTTTSEPITFTTIFLTTQEPISLKTTTTTTPEPISLKTTSVSEPLTTTRETISMKTTLTNSFPITTTKEIPNTTKSTTSKLIDPTSSDEVILTIKKPNDSFLSIVIVFGIVLPCMICLTALTVGVKKALNEQSRVRQSVRS